MTKKHRNHDWIYRIRCYVAIAMLAAGVTLIPEVSTSQPAQQPEAASSFTVLYNFTGGEDGANPAAGLIRDASGQLYGTTYNGGANGWGVVFGLDADGTLAGVHSFSGPDGANPAAGLIEDAAGNLYGTTYNGGNGNGVIFKLSTTGKETVLYEFNGPNPTGDGAFPLAGLTLDPSGNLYGTTQQGGTYSACAGYGCGVVFELSAAGKETVLYTFTPPYYVGYPAGGLIRDPSGTLYGTTSGVDYNFNGVVFKLSPSGTETVLYSFTGSTGGIDGLNPEAGLIRDASGNLYGTTFYGGLDGDGVVFELSPSAKERVLHSFAGSDGANPLAGLISDKSGNLYGTTYYGGANGYGVVFKLHP